MWKSILKESNMMTYVNEKLAAAQRTKDKETIEFYLKLKKQIEEFEKRQKE
jgi:hypothetical protein